MPTLFSQEEFAALKKATATKKEILAAIMEHGLVLKKSRGPSNAEKEKERALFYDEIEDKNWFFTRSFDKPIKVYLYRRDGIIYTKYSFRFAKSKYIEVSTGIRVISNDVWVKSDPPKKQILVYPYEIIRKGKGVPSLVSILGVTRFLTSVDNPILLGTRIYEAVKDHEHRTMSLLKNEMDKEKSPILHKVKKYAELYYPVDYYQIENEDRERRVIESYPVKKRKDNKIINKKFDEYLRRKQNANTFSQKKGQMGT